ncbi:hypothetical protein Tco_0025260 [Tanacetum coccineum]
MMGEEMAIEEANVLFLMVFRNDVSKWMLMQWSNTRLAAANTRRLLEILPSRYPYSEGQYTLAFSSGTCTTAYNDGRQTSGHQQDALSAMRMVRNNSYSGLLPEIIVIIASRLLILGPRQIAYGTLQPVVLARNMQDSFLDSFALGLVITNGVGLGSYPIGNEKLEEEFRMEINIKDSETELELNKLKDLAKAELIEAIASEKAYEIEKMQEANLNVRHHAKVIMPTFLCIGGVVTRTKNSTS